MPNQTAAVIFGGRSVEHEVSILTAHQVMDALEVAGYKTLPVYIDKQGAWFAGRTLRDLRFFRDPTVRFDDLAGVYQVSLSPDRSARQLAPHPHAKRGIFRRDPELWADVFLPCIHGTFGEDGTLQGLLELADVPYAGCGVFAAALGMDKIRSKAVCRAAGIPALDCVWTTRQAWQQDPLEFLKRVEAFSPYPVIVKPCSLGSSIGVRRCSDSRELREGVETALTLDDRALVERALVNFKEVNCAVLGPPARASACEMPNYTGDLLSFDSKYRVGGKKGISLKGAKTGMSAAGMASLNRTIPAPISPGQTAQVQKLAVESFDAIGAEGVARVDFLLDAETGAIYFNEINTVPGSLAFYLWEASGVPFDRLVAQLVESAVARHQTRKRTQFTLDANLLTARP
jgi:D-alanine-D-alanine ligase